jgi:hypothetical protein
MLPVAGSSFEAKFNLACQKSVVPLAHDSSVVKAYLAALFAGDDNEVFSYGVDPAFLRSSQSLYKPELQGSEGWYYNMSDPVQVPPTTKAPYGFFHRRLQVGIVCAVGFSGLLCPSQCATLGHVLLCWPDRLRNTSLCRSLNLTCTVAPRRRCFRHVVLSCVHQKHTQ